jgi:hypothetical protein
LEGTENSATVEPFTAASSPLSGLNESDSGLLIVENGEPDTGVNSPPAATEKTEMALPFSSVTASRPPLGLNATESG